MRVDRRTDTIWLARAPRLGASSRGAQGAIWLRAFGLACAAAALAALAVAAEPPAATDGAVAAASGRAKAADRLPRWRGQATETASLPVEPRRSSELLDPRPAGEEGRFAPAVAATGSLRTAAFAPRPAGDGWRQGAFEAVAVLDGRTFAAGSLRIRLADLEIPGADEVCRTLDGRLESCASRAATQLELLTRSRTLSCRYRPGDAADEAIGSCRLGGSDLADRLVRTGYVRRAPAAPRSAEGPEAVRRS